MQIKTRSLVVFLLRSGSFIRDLGTAKFVFASWWTLFLSGWLVGMLQGYWYVLQDVLLPLGLPWS